MSAGLGVLLHEAHPEGHFSSGYTSAVCGNDEVTTLHFVHLQAKVVGHKEEFMTLLCQYKHSKRMSDHQLECQKQLCQHLRLGLNQPGRDPQRG